MLVFLCIPLLPPTSFAYLSHLPKSTSYWSWGGKALTPAPTPTPEIHKPCPEDLQGPTYNDTIWITVTEVHMPYTTLSSKSYPILIINYSLLLFDWSLGFVVFSHTILIIIIIIIIDNHEKTLWQMWKGSMRKWWFYLVTNMQRQHEYEEASGRIFPMFP